MIWEYLEYKFILLFEGNDVVFNLKWVMFFNFIVVMICFICEIWFMEGKLIFDYYYIEIKNDFFDFEEKFIYYINYLEKV